jgi:hypothetical protein
MPSEGVRSILPRLLGPPVRLPGVVDRVAEGWWRLAPRSRSALSGMAVLIVLAAVLLRIALSPYGAPVTVLVTTGDLQAGEIPGPGDVATARWPRGLLPDAPPVGRTDLAGSRLTMGVAAGTVLTSAHLRDDGPLAGLGPGAAAVPVPTGLLRGASPGARLDLVGVAGDGTGRTIAREVRVLAVDGDTVWLEVMRERAADVAAAALRGTLSGAVLAQ